MPSSPDKTATQSSTSFEIFNSRLSSQYTQLMDTLRNAEMLYERLYGPSPADPTGPAPKPSSSGAFHQVIDGFDANDNLIAKLTEVINKLNRVA